MTYSEAQIQKDYGKPTVAPSVVQARMGLAPDNDGVYDLEPGLDKGYSIPTAIENPKDMVEQFRNSAVLAKEAGFDGVELHGANGYLVSQVSWNDVGHEFLTLLSGRHLDSFWMTLQILGRTTMVAR